MNTSRFVVLLACLLSPLLSALEPEPPKSTTKEQTIFVPFEKLEEVFGKDDRGVFLPYREFLEMWNKLNLPEKLKTTEPPVEGVLAAASYTGRVTGEVAEIKAKLTFEALKDGWSTLALGAGELSIAEAKTTAVLNFSDSGYEVLFPKKGSYELEATIFGRITRDLGRSTLQLKLPRTSVSQFELVLPEKGLDFTVTPASAFTAAENPDGTTRLLVYFGAASDVQVAWTRKTGETALTPLLFADVRTEVRLIGGAVRTDASIGYRILRAGITSLEVLVPENQQVLSVEGQNIKEWTIKAEAGAQRLHVDLHTAAKDNYALAIRLEAPLPPLPQQVKLPQIAAQKVERQTGSIAISADADLVAEVGTLEGLTQQSAPPTKDSARGLVGLYRYLRLPYGGSIAVSEAKPQIEVASATLLTIEPETLLLRAEFKYTVKKAGIFATQIELPAGFAQAEATGDQIESATVQQAEGKNVLNVKFSTRRTGEFSFTVTGEATRAKADEAVTVPVFTPREVQRHEAKVGLAIHVSLKANTSEQARGDLREEDIRNLGDLPIKDPAATPLTLGFRYRGAAKPGQVQFEPRKSRISAEVLALLEIREALIRHSWTVDYNVEYAGVNEFSIEVPKAIADDVQIEGDNIKERIKTEVKDAAGALTGAIVWRVVLQDKVLGPYQLHLTHDTARGEQKQGAVAQVALYELKPLGLFRETGQVAVIKDGNLEFTKTDAKGLELIDPKELNDELQRDGVFLAYKYAAHPLALQLDVSKNLYLDVPTAVASYAVLTSVIAEDEAETTEVIYWVRNNSQQFFSVQLPSKGKQTAKLLSDAFVNGEPQQPSKRPDKNELLIRLPARQDGDALFPVRFVYEVPSPNPGQRLGWRGTLDLQPPKLAGTKVLQTKWTLYLPADYRYVKFAGPMREVLGDRGWERFFRGVRVFVPRIGPYLPEPNSAAHNEPLALPAPKAAGFDTQIQKEGVAVVLRRLDEPAAVAVSYRGKTYAATVEAIAFLLALFGGLRLLGARRETQLQYFVFVGLGALVVAGAVNPRAAGFWQAICGGVFAAALAWIVCGVWKWVRALPGRLWRRPAGPRGGPPGSAPPRRPSEPVPPAGPASPSPEPPPGDAAVQP
ncbi:MAG: hypothetical protein QOE70_6525 [Chthoniobacter sp.]|jgi:hypothetical protein|nr:hypothetical protein [Chthoniobacter sp.]